jgi:hypothetical protein
MVRIGLFFLIFSFYWAPFQSSAKDSESRHPYYVSIYQLNYSEQDQALQITAKIFTDDLEKGLEEAGYPNVKLGTQEELPKTDQYIEAWLRDHFSIQLDDQPVEWTYLGKEAEINATWLYMEITDIEKPSKISVTNTALLEVYDSQTNMTHIDLGGEVKTLLLRGSEYSGSVTF